eukprot:scaffold76327_cov33-Tisochrysis_lutea.AAC.2
MLLALFGGFFARRGQTCGPYEADALHLWRPSINRGRRGKNGERISSSKCKRGNTYNAVMHAESRGHGVVDLMWLKKGCE